VTLGAARADEPDVEKSAKAALGYLAAQRATWLLVYDNVTSPDDIADLLPSASARVLITSRFSDWGELADEVALDVLPAEEAIAFLQSRAGRRDALGARTLAEAMGYLPLALDHAAAYCKRTQMGFPHYAAKASNLTATLPRGVGYPRSIAATFDLAITEAVAQSRAAEALMAYFAHCAPERIPMMLVDGAIEGETERMQALAALVEVSLVKHDAIEDGTPAVRVHRLVQAVARARSISDHSDRAAVQHMIAKLCAIYPEDGYDNPKSWRICGPLTPHLLTTCQASSEAPRVADQADLLTRAGRYFYGRASFEQAASLLRDALTIYDNGLNAEDEALAGSLTFLALVLRDQGDLVGARPLFERGAAILEETLGREHPKLAMAIGNLGLVVRDLGDLAAARALFERALEILEKTLGPEDADTAWSLDHLASLMTLQGDFVGARPLSDRALAIREKRLGPEHPRTSTSLTNLGQLVKAQGDLAGARPIFERALAIREKALGPEHPRTAISLDNLGLLLKDQGNLSGAQPLCERALAIREKVLGPEHPATAMSLNNLAVLLQAKGDPAGARPLCERALAINEKVLGPEHFDTATNMSNLARVLRDTGYANEAGPLFHKALAIGEKSLGRDHSLTQWYASGYARLLVATGRASEGFTVAQSALATHEAVSGLNHRWTKDSARVTADALDALGRTDEAKALRERYGIASSDDPKPS
jgi:tetratricopeptide (TPR) repeat protein